MKQLVREERLQHLLYHPNGQGDQSRSGAQGNASSRPSIGTINVIFAVLGTTGSYPSRVMSVASFIAKDFDSKSKLAKVENRLVLNFSNEDKIGTIQPHDDTLVVTLRIRGYDVKRVMID